MNPVSMPARVAIALANRGPRLGSERIDRLVGAGLAAAPFFLVFAVWFLREFLFSDSRPELSGFAVFLAGSWMLLGMMMMSDGELGYRNAIETLLSTPEDGWEPQRIQQRVGQLDRLYWPVAVLFSAVAVAAFLVSGNSLSVLIGIGEPGSTSWLLGLLIVLFIGLVSGSGLWGVLASVFLVRGAVLPARDSAVLWRPFHGRQTEGVEALSAMMFRSAIYFSAGSVFVPALLQAGPYVSDVAQFILATTIVILAAGGVVVFLAPHLALSRLAHVQRARELDQLAPSLELFKTRLLDSGVRGNHELSETDLEHGRALIDLYRELETLSAYPTDLKSLGRGTSTLVIPLFVVLLEVVARSS